MMIDITFNQAMIAHLTRSSSNSVSRAVSLHHINPVNSGADYNKRYCMEDLRKISNYLYANKERPIYQKINVFYNFKGGTGKTSICYQVASHLTLLGFNVLAIDLDPQGHLSLAMQVAENYDGPTIYDVLISGTSLSQSLLSVLPGLDLLPANISMTRIEVPLSSKTKREEKLSRILEPFRDRYDYIIMDTNPTISTLNMNALVASDRVNIVCETQPFSLAGLRVLIDEIMSFYRDMNLTPNYSIIPNKYEIKTAISQEVLGAIRSEYGDTVMGAIVRKVEEINVSAKKKLPISAFCRSKSIAFEDIMDLVHEFVRQTKISVNKRAEAA